MAKHLRDKSTAKGKDRKKRRYAKESKAEKLFNNVRDGFGDSAETAPNSVSSSEESARQPEAELKHGVKFSPKIINFGGAKEQLQKNRHFKNAGFVWNDGSKEADNKPSGKRFRGEEPDGGAEITQLNPEEAPEKISGRRFRSDDSDGGAEITRLNPEEAPKKTSGRHFKAEEPEEEKASVAAIPDNSEKPAKTDKTEKAEKAEKEGGKNKGKRLKTPEEAEEAKKKSKEEFFSPENLPTSHQLEEELKRHKNKRDNSRLVRNTIFALITVAAMAVLVATLFLPILQIYGTSMTPTLTEGDVVVSLKGSGFEQGDIISFYYNNKILVKRVIAFEGDFVNIDNDGNVYINDKLLDEPYLTEKAFGECNLELPYQVPPGKIFVLGDHRLTSIDSRSNVMGCVGEEQIVGKIVFKVWPFDGLGSVK